MNDKRTENPILNLTYQFSLEIVKFCDELELRKKYNIANQLFRSGTSVGANVCEAQDAESRADFVHKMKLAAKEAKETDYWLRICNDSKGYPSNPVLIDKITEISKILSKIISTVKSKM